MKTWTHPLIRKSLAAMLAASLAGCTAKAPSPAGEALLQEVRNVQELVGDHINHLDVAALMKAAGKVRNPLPDVVAALADLTPAAEKLESPARGTPNEAEVAAIAVDVRKLPKDAKSGRRSLADLRADCASLQERLGLLEQHLVSR